MKVNNGTTRNEICQSCDFISLCCSWEDDGDCYLNDEPEEYYWWEMSYYKYTQGLLDWTNDDGEFNV